MIEYHENTTSLHQITDTSSAVGYIHASLPSELELVDYKHGTTLLNLAASFDIETTSFGTEETPRATMYIWQFSLNGEVAYGRTWAQFKALLASLHTELNLSSTNFLLIYVHNLSYEFQFIRNLFSWDKVFAVKKRRTLFARLAKPFQGIEFRCSYLLSNFNLAYIGDNLLTLYPVKKLVGSLDYSLIRHSSTPLTEEELSYCVNDVRVVTSFIQEKIETEGGLDKIPLTNTGYVRRYCRNECFYNFQPEPDADFRRLNALSSSIEYHSLMNTLTCTSPQEFQMWQEAFAGGFTHASLYHNGDTLSTFNSLTDAFDTPLLSPVTSMDLSSAYPASAVKDYFPMSRGIHIGPITDINYFRYLNENFCVMATVTFFDIEEYFPYEHYISSHKCIGMENPEIDNGRVISANRLAITITELDFDIISSTYMFSSLAISDCYIYRRGHLPSVLVKSFLDLYADKTSLKGIDSRYTEYMVKKNMINSGYGMMVTSIVRDILSYDKDWFSAKADEKSKLSQLNSYNNSFTRFLFYPWGVYITAHVRHTIWQAILECGEDYIYSDTDSVKFTNYELHKSYFEKFNQDIYYQLGLSSLSTSNIIQKYMPRDKSGHTHPIGIFEHDASYHAFKTLGAKRYYTLTQKNSDFYSFSLTISGVNKKTAIPWLLKKFNIPHTEDNLIHKDNIRYLKPLFDAFTDGLEFPGEATGKLTSRYLDYPFTCTLIDYMGNKDVVHEASALHLSPASYKLSISEELLALVTGVHEEAY